MSEYHAALGLAALDAWPERRARLESRTRRYVAELRRLEDVRLLPGYGDGWVSAYCTVYLPADAHAVVERMARRGIETRRWWRDGVHAHVAYARFAHDELPVTADVAAHAVSLPLYHDLSDDEIVHVVDALESVLATLESGKPVEKR